MYSVFAFHCVHSMSRSLLNVYLISILKGMFAIKRYLETEAQNCQIKYLSKISGVKSAKFNKLNGLTIAKLLTLNI